MSRLYLDANALIYFVERSDPTQQRIAERIVAELREGRRMTTSELGVAECLYGAYKLKSEPLERRYLALFDEPNVLRIVPVNGERLNRAAKLGAEMGLKLADAVHFAAAIEGGCSQFLTADRRIRTNAGVEVVAIEDL